MQSKKAKFEKGSRLVKDQNGETVFDRQATLSFFVPEGPGSNCKIHIAGYLLSEENDEKFDFVYEGNLVKDNTTYIVPFYKFISEMLKV